MENREKPSLGIRICAPLFFLSGALAALLWFFYRAINLFTGTLTEVEIFDKGAFYLLGVGTGLLVLAVVTVQEGWFNKPLSKKQSAYLTTGALVSIALIFTVPHISHYLANRYLTHQGYTVCEEASHQWLFVRGIVYITNSVECSKHLTP